MAIRLLLFILFSFSFAFAQPSYDSCNSIPSDVRILNESGGLNPDGSDGVTLLVDSIGRVQMFQKGISQGQVFGPSQCPSSYGLFVSVSDANDVLLLGGNPDQTLDPVSYSAVTGTGTASDPYIATTVVTLQSAGYFTGGSEVITITDKVYGDNGFTSRSISATGLDPNLIYRFSYYLDTFFAGYDKAYAFKQGIIPGTENLTPPMPMRIGAKNNGESIMGISYGGGMPYTSYYSGHYASGKAAAQYGHDLPNTIGTTYEDNGFGVQWKIQGETSVVIESGGPEYMEAGIPATVIFTPRDVFVGEESTVRIDVSALGKNYAGDNHRVTLSDELEYVPNSLSISCAQTSIPLVSESLNGQELEFETNGFNMPDGSDCYIEFKVIAKVVGIGKLNGATIANEGIDLDNKSVNNIVNKLNISARALGSGTSSIPSSSILSLLIMVLSLSLIARVRRKK